MTARLRGSRSALGRSVAASCALLLPLAALDYQLGGERGLLNVTQVNGVFKALDGGVDKLLGGVDGNGSFRFGECLGSMARIS